MHSQNGETYLPVRAAKAASEQEQELRLRQFSAVGRVLGKAVTCEVTVPPLFPASFFRHLLGKVRARDAGTVRGTFLIRSAYLLVFLWCQEPKGLQDLEEFDPALCNQLREHVLELDITPSLADQLALDFDGLLPDGGAIRCTVAHTASPTC